MNFIFIVQGEGRGHMTQAIALRKMLSENGHIVSAVLIGKSNRREIPTYFSKNIKAPITEFSSPNFILDPKNKGLKIAETLILNLKVHRKYFNTLKIIDEVVKQYKPDVIINFYDLLAGLYSLFYKGKRHFKYVCIGHQFLLDHPEFPIPGGHQLHHFLFNVNTAISSAKADLKLALSFTQMSDLPAKKIYIVPPLLRQVVIDSKTELEDFILCYVVNDGYGDDIMEWHTKNRNVKLVCFWDRMSVEEVFQPHENLTFFKLNDVRFLDHMRRCKGFVSTAGFESICEAMFMEKPVMMVPTENHYEQLCNSLDGIKAGAGIRCSEFNLSLFVDFLKDQEVKSTKFKDWVVSAEPRFLKLLTSLN